MNEYKYPLNIWSNKKNDSVIKVNESLFEFSRWYDEHLWLLNVKFHYHNFNDLVSLRKYVKQSPNIKRVQFYFHFLREHLR